MATYKVLQDIEAEDKLLGPLSLRQFIYACIAAICLYLCYFAISKHAIYLVSIFLPPAIFTGFFAFPWGRDQPTEIWALAKIRFMFKPHRRVWDQSGVKELVTITAPKRIETDYTNGLSQTEVKSRLRALADTIDSRGWAVKNVNVNLSSTTSPALVPSDRLIDASSLPHDVQTNLDVQASDDMLDEVNSPVAQQFNKIIAKSSATHRQQLVQQLKQQAQSQTAAAGIPKPQAPPNDYWFLDQPQPTGGVSPGYVTFNPSVIGPGTQIDDSTIRETPEEKALGEQIKANRMRPDPAYAHLHTVLPLSQQEPKKPAKPNPEIYNLARNNDLNVETLARQAKRKKEDDGEVVVTLH